MKLDLVDSDGINAIRYNKAFCSSITSDAHFVETTRISRSLLSFSPFRTETTAFPRQTRTQSPFPSHSPKQSAQSTRPQPLLPRHPPLKPMKATLTQPHWPRHPQFCRQRNRRGVQSIAVSITDRHIRLCSCDSLYTTL